MVVESPLIKVRFIRFPETAYDAMFVKTDQLRKYLRSEYPNCPKKVFRESLEYAAFYGEFTMSHDIEKHFRQFIINDNLDRELDVS